MAFSPSIIQGAFNMTGALHARFWLYERRSSLSCCTETGWTRHSRMSPGLHWRREADCVPLLDAWCYSAYFSWIMARAIFPEKKQQLCITICKILSLPFILLFFFSVMVQEDYHSQNPYHNAVHAADVTQAMHCYLKEPKVAVFSYLLQKCVNG